MDQVTMTILMLVVCFGLMYFLTIRPQKKKEEELKQMMETLEDVVPAGKTAEKGTEKTGHNAGKPCSR